MHTYYAKKVLQAVLLDLDVDHDGHWGGKIGGVEGGHEAGAQQSRESGSLEALGVVEEGEGQGHAAESPPEHAPTILWTS